MYTFCKYLHFVLVLWRVYGGVYTINGGVYIVEFILYMVACTWCGGVYMVACMIYCIWCSGVYMVPPAAREGGCLHNVMLLV